MSKNTRMITEWQVSSDLCLLENTDVEYDKNYEIFTNKKRRVTTSSKDNIITRELINNKKINLNNSRHYYACINFKKWDEINSDAKEKFNDYYGLENTDNIDNIKYMLTELLRDIVELSMITSKPASGDEFVLHELDPSRLEIEVIKQALVVQKTFFYDHTFFTNIYILKDTSTNEIISYYCVPANNKLINLSTTLGKETNRKKLNNNHPLNIINSLLNNASEDNCNYIDLSNNN